MHCTFFPRFYHCRTKVWTSTLILFASALLPHNPDLDPFCTCVSVRRLGYSLIHFFSLSCVFWPPFFAVVWQALCLLGVPLDRCLFPDGVLGPVSCGLLFALFFLVCLAFFGLCAFFLVSLSCCGFVFVFGCCRLFLGCLARLCFWCVGMLRLHLTTTVGELRVSHRTENIPLL